MSYIIDNTLKLIITEYELFRDEAVSDILIGHNNKSDEEVEKAFKEYEKYSRLIEMGFKMLLDGKLEDWNWKWYAETGHLCQMDWVWFKEDLEKAGIVKNEL